MSFLRYERYKDSGVEWLGEVPEHWDITRLRFIFDIEKRIAGTDGFDVLSITQRGIKVKDITSGDGQLSSDYSKYQLVKKGYFAMNHMDLLTGYVDISKFDGVTSPDYRVFKAIDDGKDSPEFLLLLLQNGYHQKLFFPYGQGSAHLGRWRLPTEEFNNFFFPRPPYDEQSKIFKFINCETARIDALIAEQQRLIELLKEKRQSVISHAVTKGLDPTVPMKDSGVEWLGEVPGNWEVCQSKYLFESVTSGSRGWAEYYSDDGNLFFRIANLTRDTIEPKLETLQYVSPPIGSEGQRSRIIADDILISITADLGSVCVANSSITGGYVSQHVALVRPYTNKVDSRWLAYFVLSTACKDQLLGAGYGGTKIQLSLEDIKTFLICVPSYNQQTKIANFLDGAVTKFQLLINEARNGIKFLAERRSALISAAVTGKIDVRNWQSPVVN